MTVRDVAIVGRHNRYGLSRDAEILRQALECLGIQAAALDKRKRSLIDRLRRREVAELVIHLERVHPAWLGAASRHVLIPNQERFPKRHLRRLRQVDRVLAKTQHAREIFAGLGMKSTCLGFISPDRYDPTVPRDWKRFFTSPAAARSRAPKTSWRCGAPTPNGRSSYSCKSRPTRPQPCHPT